METDRIKNSKYNIIFNMIQLFSTTILSFIARSVFINILGKELLGLDGLFTNILSMLSLTELGISTAINFSLYKPIAKGDNNKVSALMTLYKNIYTKVGIIIFIIGIAIMPFLHLLINGHTFNNLYLIYILYLLNTMFSYFLIYKEALINAYQKNYKLFPIKFISTILLYSLQMLCLTVTRNFILYLVITFSIKFIQNLSISIYVSKKYSYINFKSKTNIDKETKKDIVVNVKSLFVTKIGDYLLNGTDNIIISTINIGLTGIYANYLSIVGIMKTMMNEIYNGIVASFGNLVALENKETQLNVFNISNFICFLISGFITSELIFLLNPFITFWVGKKFTLMFWMIIVISFNFYFFSQMLSLDIIKRATGKYKIDAHISIIQAIVNLLVSIILGSMMGIGGVLLGTLVSYVTIALVFKPYLIYRNIFNMKPFKYYITELKYLFTLILSCIICYNIIGIINISNLLLSIILSGIIIFIIYLLIVLIVFRKNDNLKYVYDNFIKKYLKES